MKKLEKVLCLVGAIMLVWLALSYVEILVKNTRPDPTYSDMNIITRVFTTKYEKQGRYYENGTIITDDGHIWHYTDDNLNDCEYVKVTLDNNCTIDDITDDIILDVKPIA